MINIKEKIIERIKDINDPKLLEKLLQAIDLEHDIENFYTLTKEEKKAIDDGINDADTGKLYSNSEASQLIKKWLSK